MKTFIALSAVAAATLLAAPASAADMARKVPVATPIAAPVKVWNGLYAGAIIDYGFGEDRVGLTRGLDAGVAKPQGFGGGLTIGYNRQYGNFVAGLEADAILSGMKGDSSSTSFGGSSGSVKYPWLVTVRPRAGYAFDNLLVYATAGLAVGGVEVKAAANAPAATLSKTSTRAGLAAGAGVEYAVTDKISLKAEYLFVNLQTQKDTFGPYTTNSVATSHHGRIGLNYAF